MTSPLESVTPDNQVSIRRFHVDAGGVRRVSTPQTVQEVKLSPGAAWAVFERVKTNTSSAEDGESLAHLIRVPREVTDQLRADPEVQTLPVSERPLSKPKAKRKR